MTPLGQNFIEYLTLNCKAERTVRTYVSFIYSLSRHTRRSPDLLGPEDVRQWPFRLIATPTDQSIFVEYSRAVQRFGHGSRNGACSLWEHLAFGNGRR